MATKKSIIEEIGQKGLTELPKVKIPKTPLEMAQLIVKTHVKNRARGGVILLTKVEHTIKPDTNEEPMNSYYYGVCSAGEAIWHKVDMNGENCRCNAKVTEDQCMHELAIIVALAEEIQIPTYEDLLNDDKTDDDRRRKNVL